jgi:hypothetical protein
MEAVYVIEDQMEEPEVYAGQDRGVSVVGFFL